MNRDPDDLDDARGPVPSLRGYAWAEMSNEQARDILQDNIDQVSDAIMRGDVEVVAKYSNLPYRHSFLNRETVVETRAELEADTLAWTKMLRGLGVNQFILLASDAEPLGPDHISGHVVAHCLRNAIPMTDSFLSRVTLRRSEDTWRMVETKNFITAYEYPVKSVRVPFEAPERHAAPEDDVRRAGMDALSIYQRHLDAHARYVEADDFERYCALHSFPYAVHAENFDSVIRTPDDLRPFYAVMRRCSDGTVADGVIRIAEQAEFIGTNTICGYHVGRAFKGEKQTVDDVRSRMILRREGTQWRVQSVANSISNAAYPYSMYEPGGSLKTHLEIQKRTKS